jgi:hypothetical protein
MHCGFCSLACVFAFLFGFDAWLDAPLFGGVLILISSLADIAWF